MVERTARATATGMPFHFAGEGWMRQQEQRDFEEHGWQDLMSAGQLINNPFYAAGRDDYRSRTSFKEEEGFSLYDPEILKRLNENGMEPGDFHGTWSNAELEYKIAQATKQRAARRTLEESGWRGMLSEAAGGMANPLVLATLPFGGVALAGGRLGAGIAAEMLMAGGVDLISEGLLHEQQPERTAAESVGNIAATMLLSGALVGGFGAMGRGLSKFNQTRRIDELIDEADIDAGLGRALEDQRQGGYEYPTGKAADEVGDFDAIKKARSGERAPDGSFPVLRQGVSAPHTLVTPHNNVGLKRSMKGAQSAARRVQRAVPGKKVVIQEVDGGFKVMQQVEIEPIRTADGEIRIHGSKKEADAFSRRQAEEGRTVCQVL